MTVRLITASRSDVGRIRRGNEDAFLVVDDLRLVAVADGMGGHQAGEVASATAIAALRDELERGEPIDAAITAANDAVFTQAATDESLRGMGTTITAGTLRDRTLVIGHVGDSRAYLLRSGELRQLTTDHSVIAELIASGELTEAEARVDPRRSMITRALGIDAQVVVDVLEVDLEDGDRLLLCSDGLTTMVGDPAIAEILGGTDDRDQAAARLVDAANDAGGADNITVIIADVADVAQTEETEDAGTAAAAEATGEAVPDLVEGLDEALDDEFWAPDQAAGAVPEPAAGDPVDDLAPAPAPWTKQLRRWWRRIRR